MDTGLPGSSSGKSIGQGALKAALRVLGGSDFADAIADLTGISRKRVRKLAKTATIQVARETGIEFRSLAEHPVQAAEAVLIEAFDRAAKARVPVAALMGADHLLDLVTDDQLNHELSTWSDDERGYFRSVALLVSEAVCVWYLEDPNARAHATATAVAQGLRSQIANAEVIARIDAGVEDLRRIGFRGFPPDVVTSSLRRTEAQSRIGVRPALWSPIELGVHEAISSEGHEALTAYIPRGHDALLHDVLGRLTQGSESKFVAIVGTSCSGKTRGLYEAVRGGLPTWELVAPRTAGELIRVCEEGIPSQTIVWLDELQTYLDSRDANRAAEYILELLGSPEAGPLLFAGTIWPTYLHALEADPEIGSPIDGRGAVRRLLRTGIERIITTDSFTATEVATALSCGDPRVVEAARSAGGRVTQVLTGGPQAVARMYPVAEVGELDRAYPPEVRTVIYAAADLIRIGLSGAIPAEILREAAPGYLPREALLQPDNWINSALEEATDRRTQIRNIQRNGVSPLTPLRLGHGPGDADHYLLHDYLLQDHLVRNRRQPTQESLWKAVATHAQKLDRLVLDRVASNAEDRGLLTFAIDLVRPEAALEADRSSRDRLARLLVARGDPPAMRELLTRAEAGDASAQRRLTRLSRRGTASLVELRARSDAGDPDAQKRLDRLLVDAGDGAAQHRLAILAARGDSRAMRELRTRSQDGDQLASELLARLENSESSALQVTHAVLAARGDAESLTELRARADAGEEPARARLARLLFARGDAPSFAELLARADDGDSEAQYYLADTLAARGDEASLSQMRIRAQAGEKSSQVRLRVQHEARTDAAALEKLRLSVEAGDGAARDRLSQLLALRADEDSVAELRTRADSDDRSAKDRLGRLLAARGIPKSISELRSRADGGDRSAQHRLADVLGARGDADSIAELRSRADMDDRSAQHRLADLLSARGDARSIELLRACVLSGYGGRQLLRVLRTRSGHGEYALELDALGRPLSIVTRGW